MYISHGEMNRDPFESFLKQTCFLSCRQSIKSSFRDKDKPSRFKDLQTTTRFQVEPQNEESDGSNDSQEERELLDNEYDTKYGKSFRLVNAVKSPSGQFNLS